VDLTTNQNIAGAKTFTDRIIVPSPISGVDAASKGYADGISAGISVKNSVAVGTLSALPTNVYVNGTLGVGATLTATAVGVLVIDGYTVLLNDRVMVKNEVASANNGIYTLTTLGTVGIPYILTRATDMDQSAEVNAAAAFINNGTANKGSGWVVVGTPPYTVGTTAISWTQFSSPGLVNIGLGLRQVGNTISLEIPVDPSNLPGATTSTTGTIELAGDLAGTNVLPTVVGTHLASPLPLNQGGTASTTSSAARTALGLGSAAQDNVNVTAGNIAPLGTQAAGAVGQVADAGHVHAMPTLDLVSAPAANVSMNSHKITSLANATLATDAMAFGQLPTVLPPTGSAGGDLTGTYPNPTVSKITGVAVSSTANFGKSIVASSGSAAAWGIRPVTVSSGTISGGVMTQNGGILNAFDITAAVGYIADYTTDPANPAVTLVNISAQTITLSGLQTPQVVNYWYADSSGVIHSQTTALSGSQRRSNVQLGVTWSATGTGNLYNIMCAPIVLDYSTDTLFGLFINLGSFSVSGNQITFNGANLNINKAAGTQVAVGRNFATGGTVVPNLVTNPAETVATFRYVTQNSSSQSATRTTIDVANYDNAGTITALSANGHAAIHRIWQVPTGVSGSQIVIQYGQVDYGSLALATAAFGQEIFTPNPDLIGSQACLLGYIAATKAATSLNNTSQGAILIAGRFDTA
jgi:hypothetical protein